MATALFVATALAGFVPSSLDRLEQIAAGKQPPFPLSTHVHAAAMGAWLVLSLVQALMAATGRQEWHQRLGVLAIVLGPIVVGSLSVTTIHFFLANKNSMTLAQLCDQFAFVLFVQGKATILFALFLLWGLRARLRQPQVHKRMMLLTSFAVIAAAISRIPWLPDFGLSVAYQEDLWNMMILTPMILYDAVRSPRFLWVWLVGISAMLPFNLAYYWLGIGQPTWWQQLVSNLFGIA